MLPRYTPLALTLAVFTGVGWLGHRAESSALGPPAPGAVQQVIFLSCDGLGGTLLEAEMQAHPELYPNFWRMVNEGSTTFNARSSYNSTVTIPSHTCMITGRPVYQPAGAANSVHHGVTTNGPSTLSTIPDNGNPNAGYMASVFDVVHDYGLSTALWLCKDKMKLFYNSYDATHGALDTVGADNGRLKIDRWSITENTSVTLINDFLADLNANGLATYSFVHFSDPDRWGHVYGWATPDYWIAVRQCDTQLGRILTWLDQHPTQKATTAIIVSADHGGGKGLSPELDLGSHDLPTARVNYTVPFLVRAPGFRAGSNLYPYFINRSDPGIDQVQEGTLPNQPLRNGDQANLATALLSLPTVPGSYYLPQLANPDFFSLEIARQGTNLRLSWPTSATSYVLEASPTLTQPVWRTIAGYSTVGNERVYLSPLAAADRYFRLRKK